MSYHLTRYTPNPSGTSIYSYQQESLPPSHLVLEPPCPLLVGPGEVHSAAVALEALLVVVVILVQARRL